MLWTFSFFAVFFIVVALVVWFACTAPSPDTYEIEACDCCFHWSPMSPDELEYWGLCFLNPHSPNEKFCGDHCPNFKRNRCTEEQGKDSAKPQA